MQRYFSKRDWWIIGGLTLAALLLRFVNLPHPKEIIFDETYFANFAHNYLTNTKFFDAEPPLAKFFIAGGQQLFGFNSFGWRFMPALFGAAVIPLMYVFVKRLFGGIVMPTCAALLALFDGLLLVESRTALIDIFVVFFNLLTYLLFLLHLQAKSHKHSFIFLVLTGISLGLGLSVKWITLAFIAPAIALLVVLWLSGKPRVKKLFKVRGKEALFKTIGATRANLRPFYYYLVFLALVPVALYLWIFSFHVPFDSTGESIWGIHKQIFNYHHNLTATHPYGSSWWSWPILERPVLYYFKSPAGQWSSITALGNPIIWWTGLAALAYGAWRFVKTRNLALGLVLFAFIAHFGPWALIDRVLFIYHYMGGLPFLMIVMAYALGQSWAWKPKDTTWQVFAWGLLVAYGGIIGGLLARSAFGDVDAAIAFIMGAALVSLPIVWFLLSDVRRLTWGQKQVVTFLCLVALTFAYFYPLWTGIPLDYNDFQRHLWLKSWI